MRDKMGLGIDEIVPSSLYFSRKNYADLLDSGKIKLVGNSIKSKKMPKFIEKFIDTNLPLLLHENGQQFLINYYDYIAKIYNRQIPLRDIASIGKIKISLQQYKEAMKEKNKLGNDKAKQAWYELAIRDKVNVHAGDTIYYINTGTKKGEGDVVKTPVYNTDAEGNIIKVDRKDKEGNIVYGKKGNPLQDKEVLRYEHVLNCIRIDEKILESDTEYYGNEDLFDENPIKYNIAKYVEQFNKRITGLLTCFHPDIRNEILITDPKDRKYWDLSQTKLISGMPKNPVDQDTLEELFTMEDKEIKFWLSVPDVVDKLESGVPPFLWVDEMKEAMGNWDEIKSEYLKRQEVLKEEGMKNEVELFNKIISTRGEKQTLSERIQEEFDLKHGFVCSRKYDLRLASVAELFEDSDKYVLEKVDEDFVENTIMITAKDEDLFPF
jgi:hypothetical protein